MQFEMFSKVKLKEASPEYNISQGSSAIIVDYCPRPEGQEDGYILEVLDQQGKGFAVIAVAASAIEPVVISVTDSRSHSDSLSEDIDADRSSKSTKSVSSKT